MSKLIFRISTIVFKQMEIINILNGLPRWLVVKNPPINAGDIRDSSLIPGSG